MFTSYTDEIIDLAGKRRQHLLQLHFATSTDDREPNVETKQFKERLAGKKIKVIGEDERFFSNFSKHSKDALLRAVELFDSNKYK